MLEFTVLERAARDPKQTCLLSSRTRSLNLRYFRFLSSAGVSGNIMKHLVWILTLGLALLESPIAWPQQVTADYQPTVPLPAYEFGTGPMVLVDEAHNNFHTLSPTTIPDEDHEGEITIPGRLGAFRHLLLADGYKVEPLPDRFSPKSLAAANILVISNALSDDNVDDWSLPNPSAFITEEIDAVITWVDEGGAILLIADHQPWPAAASALASRLGFIFNNGYASVGENETDLDLFLRSNGTLVNHPITRGRFQSESVDKVMTFGGQAFRAMPGQKHDALMIFPPNSLMMLLEDPFGPEPDPLRTPRIRVDGMLQGAVREFGRGRVAVFGEAAMFTAQLSDDQPMGMNHPEAAENAQFVLNVFHWLSGLMPVGD